MPILNLRLLGSFEATLGGRRVEAFGYDKVRALLAYLAVECGEHRRQAVAELLWPEQGENAARTNLRQALLKLRRALGADADAVLRVARDRLSLSPAVVDTDVDQFLRAVDMAGSAGVEDLQATVALYTGPFLGDLVISDSCEFAHWVETRRADLHRRALETAVRWMESCGERGDGAGEAAALKVLELDPWHEAAHRQLMAIYAADGRRSMALHQFETCRKALREELGVEPAPATEALRRRIVAGELAPAEAAVTAPGGPGERRQVTVISGELVGLSPGDPEEVFEAVTAFHERSARIIDDLGGHVAWVGDSRFVGYFGCPQADEAAARNSVEAAMAIAEHVYFHGRGHGAGRCFARVGVCTGVAVTVDGGARPTVIGSVQNQAEDCRAQARGGTVIVGAATARMITGFFVVRPLRDESMFRVLRETGARSRIDASVFLTPLVGRTRELDELARAWMSLRKGAAGGCIILRGEPGIGKSRLVHAFRERVDASVVEADCSQRGAVSGHPAAAVVRKLAGIPADAGPRQQRERLRAVLGSSGVAGEENEAVVRDLLGIGQADEASPQVSVERRRESLLEVFRALARLHTETAPLLIIVEDIHWIDPTSADFIRGALQSPGTSAVWLLTGRPEIDVDAWPGAELIDVGPLSRSQAELLAQRGAGGVSLTSRALAEIVSRCDGVPLYLEEVVRLLADADRAGEGGLERIPESLFDLLMMRLDRLGADKGLAQRASCVGRSFSLALVAAVAEMETPQVREGLERLVTGGLLVHIGRGGSNPRYAFKHALIQEAAYQSQLRRDRQRLHRRIAEVMLRVAPRTGDEHPEELAHHLNEAGDYAGAVPLWLQAGQRDARRSAVGEAISHLENALHAARRLPDNQATRRWELEIHLTLAGALAASEGYGSEAFKSANTRALELCRSCSGGPELFRILWGLWLGASTASDYRAACHLATELERMARDADTPAFEVGAHYALGNNLFWMGEFERALEHQRAAVRAYGRCDHETLVTLLGENAYVGALAFMGWTRWHLGEADEALACSKEAVAVARQHDHPHTLAMALIFAAQLHRFRQEPAEAGRCAREVLSLAGKHGFALWAAAGKALLGWAKAAQGDEAGIPDIVESLEGMRRAMDGVGVTFLAILAEANGFCRRYEDGLRCVSEALGLMGAKGDHYCEPELYRMKGEFMSALRGRHDGEAIACLKRALQLAQSQKARLPAARAAAALDSIPPATPVMPNEGTFGRPGLRDDGDV